MLLHRIYSLFIFDLEGEQWLSGRVLDSRLKGRGFKPHRRYCVVSLSKNINPSLVLVQPRKTCPFITERLLMGCKESNQTNKIFDLNPGVTQNIAQCPLHHVTYAPAKFEVAMSNNLGGDKFTRKCIL